LADAPDGTTKRWGTGILRGRSPYIARRRGAGPTPGRHPARTGAWWRRAGRRL